MALRDMVPWRRQTAALTPTTDTYFRSFQQEMNRLLSDFWGDLPQMGGLNRIDDRVGAFIPDVEVSESQDAIDVTAELPGMSEEDVELTLSPSADALLLRGEKRLQEEKREQNFYRCERAYGAFQRAIDLPASVDPDKVEARFENGVIHVHLPKQPGTSTGARQIPIKK